MKNRVYIFLAILFICLTGYLTFRGSAKAEYIAQGYVVENIADEWKSTISFSVNNSNFFLNVDGVEVNARDRGIYMDTTMVFMIPYKEYRDLFNCAVNLYDGNRLVIEKGNIEIQLKLDSSEIIVNDIKYVMNASVTKKDNMVYVPIDAAVRGLGYTCNWDVNTNTATIISNSADGNIALPFRYSYVDENKTTEVRTQGALGTCWAMAALTALETSLMPEEKLTFSVDHMSLCNSFNLNQYEGGSSTMSTAYLLAWQGPVLEKDDPYGDGKTNEDLTPVKHVQEIQMIESKDLQKIKEMVYKYGGVQSSLYTTMLNSTDYSRYYNADTYAYCYVGMEKPNHDVVIIGWDDNYPKENFNTNIESDGAFICQNSWGTDFGDNGIFYVSYYDSNIGMHNIVYTKVEDVDNYTNIYQTDLCGWVGRLGYEREEAWFSNVYTARETEFLSAAGFYATGVGTEYEVYVCTNYQDVNSLNGELQKVASGSFVNEGYYTVEFDEMIQVTAGDQFAVVVKIRTPNATRPVAVEYVSEYYTETVDISDGEGYVSADGNEWVRTEDSYACNICLKCYTRK
ncbi:MAG: lectin like domain-containing protein [Lachnospiraceae bacterium]|nr:lectin like domain-containing protein [Lachnospiraceae bacterium]